MAKNRRCEADIGAVMGDCMGINGTLAGKGRETLISPYIKRNILGVLALYGHALRIGSARRGCFGIGLP